MGNGVKILSKKVIKISYNKYTESTGILNDSITGILCGSKGQCNLQFWVVDKTVSGPLI